MSESKIQIKDWITEKLKKNKNQREPVYQLYQDMLKAFPDSTMKADTYSRYVRNISRALEGEVVDKGGFFVAKEEQEEEEALLKEELWLAQERRSNAHIAKRNARIEKRIEMQEELPIAIAFPSDQHLGGDSVDHGKMRRDQEIIARTPGFYQISGGDTADNAIKHIGMMTSSNTSPSLMLMLLDYLVSIAPHSFLGVIGGNHDYWTKQVSGLDYLSKYFLGKMIPFSNHFCMFNINLGEQEYKILVRHKYRFNSSLNITHTVKRMWSQGDYDFDIGVVAHHHEGAFEPFVAHGKERWAVRCSSYQLFTSHSDQNGYNTTIPRVPTAILYPDTKKIIMLPDIAEAAEFLTSERLKYQKEAAISA